MEMKKYLPIIKKGEACKVYLERIVMIEQELRKTNIYTDEGTYSIYGKMDEMIQYLDKSFLQCHQSCIINLDKVVRMKEQTVFFESGHSITMARDKFRQTIQSFARYIQS